MTANAEQTIHSIGPWGERVSIAAHDGASPTLEGVHRSEAGFEIRANNV